LRRRTFLVKLVLVLLAIMLISATCLVLFMMHQFGMISYPSSEMLARQYLDAIMRRDLDAAINLAYGSSCQKYIAEQARRDIEQYGDAEIRSVEISTSPGGGSSETFELVGIQFEYRFSDQSTEWQRGSIGLWSDYNPPGLRHLCTI
jgi:hypothetical protein